MKVLGRENRRRLFSLGTRLWHSDSSFKVVPAKFSLLSARIIPSEGGNTEFADMRAAWDTLDPETQAECLPLVCEHSQLFSRALIGFGDFTEEERKAFAPVQQRLAFAVVVEHGGYGAKFAAPIGRELIEAAGQLNLLAPTQSDRR